MNPKFDFEIDNRDMSVTELHVVDEDGKETGVTVEVNPWELLENVFENAGEGEMDEIIEKLESMVRTLKSERGRM